LEPTAGLREHEILALDVGDAFDRAHALGLQRRPCLREQRVPIVNLD
jgi:hypothetical protein